MVLRHWPPLSFGSTVQPGVFRGILHPSPSHPHLLSGGAALRSRTEIGGDFLCQCGKALPEHAPNWVGISLGLLPGSTRDSCLTVGSATPLCSADINCINPRGQWMRRCTVEYKFRMLQKKKIRKYSKRLRRIEVLNCSLSTSHILIINLCVNTCDFFSDIWIRYAAFFCVSKYI